MDWARSLRGRLAARRLREWGGGAVWGGGIAFIILLLLLLEALSRALPPR